MKRLQRLRYNSHIRNLCAETEFSTAQLIQPLFAVEGIKAREEIKGLRGTHRLNVDDTLRQIESDIKSGVTQFILFQVPSQKKDFGFTKEFSTKVISEIKNKFGAGLQLWVDTCLCSLTTHGHCCVFTKNSTPQKYAIDSEATLKELSDLALSYAQAGCDGVSPSDMMDGRVAAMRTKLDGGSYLHIPVMSYSTKFASNFYGPFRNAADSAPQFGDRKQYQIDVRNRADALNASIRCAEEGADLLMIKPGMPALDLIAPIKEATGLQVGAYQVSGEYAGLHYMAENGLIDFNAALLESWHCFKRAGAQYIITYGARYAKEMGVLCK